MRKDLELLFSDCNERKLIHMVKIHTDKNVVDLLTKAFDFWSTVKAKMVNGEVQLQALVDGKKIIVTEASVRSVLQLDDEEGMDYLPNATIFKELTRMSSKTTAWNEFSSTMASAIICLATNQKFVQVFLDKQLEGMQSQKRIYDAPSHTKKIFGNMKRVGKGFSGRETPLFPTMMVQNQAEIDEVVNEEMDDSLERTTTTATSLDAEQDSDNLDKTQFKATPNEPGSPGTSSGGGPRCQETIGDTIAQTRSENVSKFSNDPLLARGNTPRSSEDRLKLKELMELCTNLQNRVIDLEKTKTSQAQEITSLKIRVNRLENKGGSRTHGLKRLYKVVLSRRVESSNEEGLGEEDASKLGRIADIDADAGINLVSLHFDADTNMFGVHDLVSDEVVVDSKVAVKAASTIPVSAATTTTTIITDDEITLAKALAELKSAKLPTTIPKAKGIVIHEQEQAPTPTVSSRQPSQLNIQDKAWDDVQARVKADYQLAQRLQAQEQEELTNKEKARLFVQFLEQRRKHFATKRAEENSKRAGTGLEQESIKKQKVDENKDTTELQRLIEVVPDKEEVAIDSIPLATKPLSIVDYKIHKEGKKTYYQIIRADGSLKMYLVFSHMLKNFDKEDLETLWKSVKAKHGSTRTEEGYKKVI
ncbi:hypothetical protein Tco_1494049 [Tanacetum coccineum]